MYHTIIILHSPFWHMSPVTPGGQWQNPLTGSHIAPFLHLHVKEQFLPKVPSGQAGGQKHHTGHTLAVCPYKAKNMFTTDSLWLQIMPVQPSGQSQPLFSSLHTPPLEQSSQVRLQS